jgi:hypothetical protein
VNQISDEPKSENEDQRQFHVVAEPVVLQILNETQLVHWAYL